MTTRLKYIHVGPPYPQGRNYLVPTRWAKAFKKDPTAHMHLIYGLYRVDGPKVGAKIRVVLKGQLPFEELYMDTVREAQKLIKAKAREYEELKKVRIGQ